MRAMTQTSAGWHPDPHVPGQQRYWDGTAWTDHVAPLLAPPGYGGKASTTPDGQPLAGWWRRVAAQVLDGLILFPLGFLAAFPWWKEVWTTYADFIEETIDASDAGRPAPNAMDLQGELFGTLLTIALISLVLNFAYVVGFLAWKQATPGKLALGLRVRRRDVAGPMPLGVILRRWAVVGLPSLVGLVPFVGSIGSLVILLDYLWPLWDDQRQAIHDKVAGTNVVLKR